MTLALQQESSACIVQGASLRIRARDECDEPVSSAELSHDAHDSPDRTTISRKADADEVALRTAGEDLLVIRGNGIDFYVGSEQSCDVEADAESCEPWRAKLDEESE